MFLSDFSRVVSQAFPRQWIAGSGRVRAAWCAAALLAAGLVVSETSSARAQKRQMPAPGTASSSSSSSASDAADAQEQEGSSSRGGQDQNPAARPRAAQIEAGGAAVTLETSEPLFTVATALNACGYDADLEHSAPVRAEVRADVNEALAASEPARSSRDALCAYVDKHRLGDSGLNVGQYVSLSLYLSPPPELTPNADETELPPQAAQVVNVLPLLRDFAEKTKLHVIWLRHRPEYEALAERVHDPMTQAILQTNIYLHQPVSSYDGRRFLVLLEPMLSPALTNARIYGSDYIIVLSPDDATGEPVKVELIRHIYLHYVVEPMVYARGAAMERLQPLLRSVADAPLEYVYKSDVEALITECLIKAIEARMYTIATPAPRKPSGAVHERSELTAYATAKDIYDRQTAIERQKLVDRDEQGGWVLTGYFYQALEAMEHSGDGLRDEIAPMMYGMDIQHEQHRAQNIVFAKERSVDPLRRSVSAPRKLEGLDLAEADLAHGDRDGARELAEKALNAPAAAPEQKGRAQYVLGRVALTEGDPETAMAAFEDALKLSRDPRTLAWSHIYLGRLYDAMQTPDREHAVAEYKAALAVRDARPDTRAAAEAGLKKPFAPPQRTQAAPTPQDEDKDFDPTGKKEKEAYRPK